MEIVWIEDGGSFYNKNEEGSLHTVKWSKNYSFDLLELSNIYFEAGYTIGCEIVSGRVHDNVKSDMWFLPAIYLFRQSIELLLKGGIACKESYNPTLQNTLKDVKHRLPDLYETLLAYNNESALQHSEREWVNCYLDSIERIDSSSDLFRYPHTKEFLEEYYNKFLDVCDMLNRLMLCYNLLHKEVYGDYHDEEDINSIEKPSFFSLASHGIGNCHIWDSPWGDGFHKQVTGYSEAGNFLYNSFNDSDSSKKLYPAIFLYRNAIELGLKRLLFTGTEVSVEDKLAKKIKNTHELYKDLWKNIKPILVHYADKQGYDLTMIEIAESYIKELRSIDKNSDIFRYPFTYSLEYKFNDIELDVENVHRFLKGIFNFIDSCDHMFNSIRDYESEMRNYWY